VDGGGVRRGVEAACGGRWGATVREGKKKGSICLTADGVGGYGSGGATVRGEDAEVEGQW
jgi:hypothetical protein